MINAVEVERDKNGFWTHPNLPEWDESVTPKQIRDWQFDNNVMLFDVMFDDDAPEDIHERYFDDEEFEVLKEWQPTKLADNAFLLSIHDTEDGPVAIWALPITKTDK